MGTGGGHKISTPTQMIKLLRQSVKSFKDLLRHPLESCPSSWADFMPGLALKIGSMLPYPIALMEQSASEVSPVAAAKVSKECPWDFVERMRWQDARSPFGNWEGWLKPSCNAIIILLKIIAIRDVSQGLQNKLAVLRDAARLGRYCKKFVK